MAMAGSYDVLLGGKSLGSLSYEGKGSSAALRTRLSSTPLGVFDGTFSASSKPVQSNGTRLRQYLGESASSRKTRTISVLTDRGRVVETAISPKTELTDLSDPSRVGGRVIDPVTAFGQMVGAKGCPGAMRIYDGRRVVSLAPGGSAKAPGRLTCDMRYTVTAGPGHLSPLYISKVAVGLAYDTRGGRQVLSEMKFTSGVFSLRLARRN